MILCWGWGKVVEKIFTNKNLGMIFYLFIFFALLGPTFGINLHPEFKLTFFRILFFVLLFGLAARYLKYKKWELDHLEPIRWYAFFFIFWFVYALISLAWVINMSLGIRYIVFLAMMLLFCFSYPYFIKGLKEVRTTLAVLFVAFVIMVYFGVFESVTYVHLPSSRYWGYDSASVTSFFNNQNDFATMITISFPFLITALYGLKLNKKLKVFIYITIIFTIYCLLATGSRSNTFFALPLIIIAGLISIPFTVAREKLTKKNIFKGIAVVLSISLFSGILSYFLLANNERQKLASTFGIFQDLKTGPTDLTELENGEVVQGAGTGGHSITSRKFLLLHGLDFLQKSYYFGVGAGNVEAHMKGKSGVNTENIHNWWAEILVNFGVLVFLPYMFLYAWLVYRLWNLARLKKSAHVSPVLRWAALACMLSLIGYFFGGMAPSTAIHFTPMWTVLGLSLAIVALGERQKLQTGSSVASLS
jgi:teichuronic acid biosynthesis protein TuaE